MLTITGKQMIYRPFGWKQQNYKRSTPQVDKIESIDPFLSSL